MLKTKKKYSRLYVRHTRLKFVSCFAALRLLDPPASFLHNSYPFYIFAVPLGSIPELPAETCKEIKLSEGHAVSGKYWLNSIVSGKSVLAQCDMETERKLNRTTPKKKGTILSCHLSCLLSYPRIDLLLKSATLVHFL